MVGPPGVEPGTRRASTYRSTNWAKGPFINIPSLQYESSPLIKPSVLDTLQIMANQSISLTFAHLPELTLII